MAYTIPPLAIVEISMRAMLFGQTIMMVRHYQRAEDETTDLPDGASALDGIMASFDDPVEGFTAAASVYWTTEFTVSQLRAQWIYPTRWAYRTYTPAVAAGTKAPPTLSQNLSLVATLRSDTGGRHGRGNVFFTGFEEDCISGGLLTGATRGHVGALGDNLMRVLGYAAGVRHVVPVIYRRAVPTASATITTQTVQPEVRVMRRRTVGRGI